MVVQWLALGPHSREVAGSMPGLGPCWVECYHQELLLVCWSLCVDLRWPWSRVWPRSWVWPCPRPPGSRMPPIHFKVAAHSAQTPKRFLTRALMGPKTLYISVGRILLQPQHRHTVPASERHSPFTQQLEPWQPASKGSPGSTADTLHSQRACWAGQISIHYGWFIFWTKCHHRVIVHFIDICKI